MTIWGGQLAVAQGTSLSAKRRKPQCKTIIFNASAASVTQLMGVNVTLAGHR